MSHHAEILTAPDLETLGEVFILFLFIYLASNADVCSRFGAVVAEMSRGCLHRVNAHPCKRRE